MDLITQLPTTGKGNISIVVFVDQLLKIVRLATVQTSIDANKYAELYSKHVCETDLAKHLLPKSIVSDRDPRSSSEFFSKLCGSLYIKQGMSTAYYPQTYGQVERVTRTLEEMLRAFVSLRCDDGIPFFPTVNP